MKERSYLYISGGGGLGGCGLSGRVLETGDHTRSLSTNFGVGPIASGGWVARAGLGSAALHQDIPAAVPADEDCAARTATTTLDVAILAGAADTGVAEGDGEETHKSEEGAEGLHCLGEEGV